MVAGQETNRIRNHNSGLRTYIDLQAEEFLVASILIETQYARQIHGICDGLDFTDAKLGEIFDGIMLLALTGRHGINDPIALLRILREVKVNADHETIRRVIATGYKVLPHNAKYYADIVGRMSKMRKIQDSALQMLGKMGEHTEPEEVISWMESRLSAIRTPSVDQSKFLHECWEDSIKEFEQLEANAHKAALMSGMPSCDSLGFVFVPGELTIIAARPGCGKTTLATQILKYHAQQGRTTMIASLEMKQRELSNRLLTAEAGVNYHVLRCAGVKSHNIERMREAKNRAGKVPMVIWGPGRVTTAEIMAEAQLVKQRHGLDLLAVDYIGWIKHPDTRMDKRDRVGEITKELRDIGQRLQVPVIAICQLNRDADNHEPKLNNLADSSAIEQDADIVAFLHRPDKQEYEGQTSFIVEKARNGPGGKISLLHDKNSTLFTDPTAPKANETLAAWANGDF